MASICVKEKENNQPHGRPLGGDAESNKTNRGKKNKNNNLPVQLPKAASLRRRWLCTDVPLVATLESKLLGLHPVYWRKRNNNQHVRCREEITTNHRQQNCAQQRSKQNEKDNKNEDDNENKN